MRERDGERRAGRKERRRERERERQRGREGECVREEGQVQHTPCMHQCMSVPGKDPEPVTEVRVPLNVAMATSPQSPAGVQSDYIVRAI